MKDNRYNEAIDRGYTYDKNTGYILNRDGDIMDTLNPKGYIQFFLRIDGKATQLSGHQFAWFYTYKTLPNCIDHINNKRNDNRIDNLRSVTQQVNCFNRSNVKGYCWDKINEKWQSSIKLNGRQIYLGRFNNEIDARQAYLDAKKIYHK